MFRVRSEVFDKKGEACTHCGACEGAGMVLDKIPDCVFAAEQKRHADPRGVNSLISEISSRVIKELNK